MLDITKKLKITVKCKFDSVSVMVYSGLVIIPAKILSLCDKTTD